MKKILNEGNQIHTFIWYRTVSVRTFVIPFYYGSGSAEVLNLISVPVPQQWILFNLFPCRFLLRGGDRVHDAAVPDPRGRPRDSPGGRANRVPQPRLQICLSPGRRTQARMLRI
jgi:hypothetical protein